jgi:hypothetical protein
VYILGQYPMESKDGAVARSPRVLGVHFGSVPHGKQEWCRSSEHKSSSYAVYVSRGGEIIGGMDVIHSTAHGAHEVYLYVVLTTTLLYLHGAATVWKRIAEAIHCLNLKCSEDGL